MLFKKGDKAKIDQTKINRDLNGYPSEYVRIRSDEIEVIHPNLEQGPFGRKVLVQGKNRPVWVYEKDLIKESDHLKKIEKNYVV